MKTPSLAATILVVTALLLAACGSGREQGDGLDAVSVQLEGAHSPLHAGLYVAQANGWYRQANLRVVVLPLKDIAPEAAVAAGKADLAFGRPETLIAARATGRDVVSVAAVSQRRLGELAVLADSDARRPRDLDGRLFAAWGSPYELSRVRALVRADSGRGEFPSAVLATAASEALFARRAVFAELSPWSDGLDAGRRGLALRYFRYEDYGLPAVPGVVLMAKPSAMQRRGTVLRRFLDVTRRGYEFAAANPEESAKLLLQEAGRGNFPEPKLLPRSLAVLAPSFVDSDGRWGRQDGAAWQAYAALLLADGAVIDGKGRALPELLGGPLWTDELLD